MRKQAVIAAATMALAIGTVAFVATDTQEQPAADRTAVRTQAGAGAGLPAARTVATGLTADQRIVRFRVDRPGRTASLGRVRGLTTDHKLIGIDHRVQNGKLYGVGDRGGIYTLSGARATKVSQLSVALRGTSFGVDFNPAANRLRVISDTGQNLRHNIDDPAGAPAAGTTAVDGTLTNPPVPPATTGTTARGVTAAAYTNNDRDTTTATTLFDLDTALDQTSIQSPANAGNLAPTGNLGVDAGSEAGFDILTSGTNNTGYATLRVGGAQRLYRVNLLSGSVARLGTFAKPVVDVALPVR